MARPNGVLEKLAAFMGEETCARLRPGAPVDAVISSCVFLSVVAFLVVTGQARYAPAWPFAMGCSPHLESHSPRGVGAGRADVGVSGITPRGESQPQHPAGLAKVVAVDGESDGQRKMGGAAEEGPDQQAPVVETFATKNAETDIGMEERHEISPVQ